MEELTNENVYDEKTREELSVRDESWGDLLELKGQWNEDVPLPEELRKLDEEQKQQIAEAKAWIEEEEAMDEILRKEIADLQLYQRNTSPIMVPPDIPAEVEDKIFELEDKVQHLQNQLEEKTLKVTQVSDMYTELLNQFNDSREKSLAADKEFKTSLAKIKEDYAEVEALLKSEIDRYKTVAKELQLKLTEEEILVNNLCQERDDALKMKNELETKYNESAATVESLNKYILKVKFQLKNIKKERDALKKDKESNLDMESLKERITLLEEEKGNLQLQVIDLDEIKEAATATQKKYEDLEISYDELKNSTSLLVNEKERVHSSYEHAKSKIKDQQSIIHNLQKTGQESEEQKIIAVMRSAELEEQLSSRDKELVQLKEEKLTKVDTSNSSKDDKCPMQIDDDLLEQLRILQEEKSANCKYTDELKSQFMEMEKSLNDYLKENASLQNIIDQLGSEKNELEKQLSEAKLKRESEETLKREVHLSGSGSNPAATPPAESDPLYQKFKKVVANYKIKSKLCQELENKLENINIELKSKEENIDRINLEKQQLEASLSASTTRLEELNCDNEVKLRKIKELVSVVEQMCNIDMGIINENTHDLAIEELIEKWQAAREADVGVIQQQVAQLNSVLLNVAKLENELEELKKSLKDKDQAINDLEEERIKLSDVVKLNEKELEMLRSMYNKVSEKNEMFYSDLLSIEEEMASGKTELLSRLEVVTQNYDKCLSNLQEKENYIETLEQDIVTMKTKMYNIESGMDERHRILKESSDQLMAKFQATEIMSQTFEKYKSEVEVKIESLQESKRKAEENELQLKELVAKLETDREFILKENEECVKNMEQLIKEKEISESKLLVMSSELDDLRDIKNSYNTTLDKIEELNSDLTQTALSFELKSQRLELLEQERIELISKNNLVEETCSSLEGKVDELEVKNITLESEVKLKEAALEEMQFGNTEFMNKFTNLENLSTLLEKQRDECLDKINMMEEERSNINQQYGLLVEEKRDLLAKIKNLENSCTVLNGKLEDFSEQILNLENEVKNKCSQLSEANQKQFDLQTQLVESETLCASLQDEMIKLEKYVQEVNVLQEEKRHLEELLKGKTGEKQLATDAGDKADGGEQIVNVFTWTDEGGVAVPPDNPFSDTKDADDGWGWMAEEATLEHHHKHSEAVKIQELTNKLVSITEERDSYLNELNATKTKCQKLMKKIREIKTINENLERSKNDQKVGFTDLDFALQEELRIENDKLQAKLTEMNSQICSLRTEKDSLLKRVDTLGSANDQLVDLKERQDLEVQMWQKKSNQLMNEVKSLKLSLETKEGNSSNSMPDKISELVRENDELKLIIDTKNRELEVKTKEIDLELPEKFAALVCENEELIALLNMRKYEEEVKIKELIEKLKGVESEKEKLAHNLESKDQQIQELNMKVGDPDLPDKYIALNAEYQHLKDHLTKKESERAELLQLKFNLETNYKNGVDFSQQFNNVEGSVSVKENFESFKTFSFDDNNMDLFPPELQQSDGDKEEMRISIQLLTEETISLKSYIAKLEDELQRMRIEIEAEKILKTDTYKDDLSWQVEETALWKQKEDELFNVIKDNEQKLMVKDEENAYLINVLSIKEQSLKDMTSEMHLLRSEIERLQHLFTTEKEAFVDEINTLNERVIYVTQQSVDRESEDALKNMIHDLEIRLENATKADQEKDNLIKDLNQQIKLKGSDERLINQQQDEVITLRGSLVEGETKEQDNVIIEKDNEIGRLTKMVLEMQGRLLRMEEGRLLTSISELENRLDKALYTIHIRDVRCQELTQEIMQLLEERDTLQFRLIESLRVINDLSMNKEENVSSSSSPVHTTAHAQASPITEKISELRHEYRRDPNVQMESKNRHIHDMQLYAHSEQIAAEAEVSNSSIDYGIFNWFFGGSSESHSSTVQEVPQVKEGM